LEIVIYKLYLLIQEFVGLVFLVNFSQVWWRSSLHYISKSIQVNKLSPFSSASVKEYILKTKQSNGVIFFSHVRPSPIAILFYFTLFIIYYFKI